MYQYLFLFFTLVSICLNAREISKEEIQNKLDDRGYFTKDGLKEFLENESKQNRLSKDFESVSCFESSEDLARERGGGFTRQLFEIESKCLNPNIPELYIFKGEKEIKDYEALQNLTKNNQLKPYIWPNKKIGFPSLILPIEFYEYTFEPTTGRAKTLYSTLMPKAPGREIKKIYADSEKSIEDKIKAFNAIGSSVSKFHQAFMEKKNGNQAVLRPTVIQGDLQWRNVFYDELTGQVSFIDNPAMQENLQNPKDPVDDIARFIMIPVPLLMVSQKDEKLEAGKNWIKLIVEPFLKGYIETFPSEQQKIYDEIKNKLEKVFPELWKHHTMTYGRVFKTNFPYEKIKPFFDDAFEKLGAELSMPPSLSDLLEPLGHALTDLQKALERLEQALNPGGF